MILNMTFNLFNFPIEGQRIKCACERRSRRCSSQMGDEAGCFINLVIHFPHYSFPFPTSNSKRNMFLKLTEVNRLTNAYTDMQKDILGNFCEKIISITAGIEAVCVLTDKSICVSFHLAGYDQFRNANCLSEYHVELFGDVRCNIINWFDSVVWM